MMIFKHCRCGCGRGLDDAEEHYQAMGFLDASHKARADRARKRKKPAKRRKQSRG